MLEQEGECLGVQELSECLNLLVGDPKISSALPENLTSDEFAENILGFEEVEEVEDENEEGEMMQNHMMASYAGMGGNSY